MLHVNHFICHDKSRINVKISEKRTDLVGLAHFCKEKLFLS